MPKGKKLHIHSNNAEDILKYFFKINLKDRRVFSRPSNETFWREKSSHIEV